MWRQLHGNLLETDPETTQELVLAFQGYRITTMRVPTINSLPFNIYVGFNI